MGLLRKMAWTMPATPASRSKLSKKHREQKIVKICSKEMLDAVRKSSIGLCLQNQEALDVMRDHLVSPEPRSQHIVAPSPSNISYATPNINAVDQMRKSVLKRTRPKTPILSVGQQEYITKQSPDKARKLAADYQAVLPTHLSSDEFLPDYQPLRRLRKVKSQISLRDLSKDQAEEQIKSPIIDLDGDVETLIGSEPPTLDSRIQDEFWRVPYSRKPNYASVKTLKGEADIGLRICVDLLTNELASVLFRHHPIEESDRASELQILLMIEAYETIQKQIHEKCFDPQVSTYHMTRLDELLEIWLDALYDLYERSREPDNATARTDSDYWASSISLCQSRAEVQV